MRKMETGRIGEDFTAEYLQKNGYDIICRNYKIKGGEIDIIAVKGEIIAFVEVKTRKPDSLQNGFEAVDKNKKRRIIRTSEDYIWRCDVDLQPRYDIASVVCENGRIESFDYIENAFSMIDLEN